MLLSSLALMLSLGVSTVTSANNVIAEVEFDGDPTHGTNIFNDEIMTTYDSLSGILNIPWAGPFTVYDFWSSLSFFPEIGVYDPTPGSLDAKRITSATSQDSLMASKWDERAGSINDQPPEIQAMYNVPIHDPFLLSSLSGARSQIPAANGLLTSKLQSQRKDDVPITLERWNSVSGKIELKCYEDGTGLVKIEAQNLIPDGIYTVWTPRLSSRISSTSSSHLDHRNYPWQCLGWEVHP